MSKFYTTQCTLYVEYIYHKELCVIYRLIPRHRFILFRVKYNLKTLDNRKKNLNNVGVYPALLPGEPRKFVIF